MLNWLADFEHGTSGFCAVENSVSRHNIEPKLRGSAAFEEVTVFWFSDPATAFAFKMRWA